MSESRQSKRKLEFSNEENKKIRAVFCEEDDISLLKAMIDYEVSKLANPYDDMGKLLAFVKPSLSFDVERKQLTNRLWRLKNKYVYSDYDISKPHHAKLLELSKSIKAWECHANMSLDDDNVVNGDGQNVRGDDVVVGKSSKVVENKGKGKVVENKGKGKVVTCDGRNVEQDNVAIGDADVLNEGLKVGKKKRKHLSRDGQNVVSCDGQNVRGDNVVGDIDVGKSSKVVENKEKGKVVENKGKGKVVTCDSRNVEQDNVAIGDVDVLNEGLKEGKKEKKHLSKDGQTVVNKTKRKVVTCDGQNAEQDNVEVNIKDLKGFTSMFPELTNMLELETLSKMPQPIKKKCVRDTIDSLGWEKANELEEEWVGVRLMEMELKAKKLELTSK